MDRSPEKERQRITFLALFLFSCVMRIRISRFLAGWYAGGMKIFSSDEMWIADLLVLVGLGLLGAAVWLVAGWPAALAYAGVVLVALGLALVYTREVRA